MSTEDETNEPALRANLDERAVFQLDFGRVIARERGRRGWSAEEAARRADLAPKTWLRVENGKPVRPRTYMSVDELFDLRPGTTLRAWQEGGDLQEAIDQVQREQTRARHPQMTARVAAELDADELAATGRPGMPEAIRTLAEAGLPIQIGRAESDRDVIMQAVTRLTPASDDERVRAVLKDLVPIAFAGIVNEWTDLFDDDGNLLAGKGKREDDGER